MRVNRFYTSLLSAVVLTATCNIASAQQSTSATYSNWVLQCVSEGSPPNKICEIAQLTQVQGKNMTFSRVAMRTPVKGKPDNLIIQVPVNVSVRDPAEIEIPGTPQASTVSAPFERCVPAGCFAEAQLKAEVLKKLTATEGMGKVTFKDAAGREIAFPLSFKGFREAFDALSKVSLVR